MRKKWKIVIIVFVVLMVMITGLRMCSKAALKKIAQSSTLQTAKVTRGEIVSKIEITGEIQPETVVSLKSKVSGKIVKFYADENDYVKAGQIIADIEPDYNQAISMTSAKAQLANTKLALEQARSKLADNEVLHEKGYLTDDAYAASVDAVKSAETAFYQAKTNYDYISDLDVPGKVIQVYATSSGMVIERKVEEGEMIQSSLSSYGEGTVLMKIADLSRMVVKSKINEVDIAKFSLKQEAEIKLDALPYESYQGQIVKIAPSATTENNAKVFAVEISINATGETVKPGMTAAVTIIGEARKDVLIIPIRTVFTDDKNQDVVYVMPKTSGKTEKGKQPAPQAQPLATAVKLGANDLQSVEVISGLKEGDEISLNEPNAKQTNMQMMMR